VNHSNTDTLAQLGFSEPVPFDNVDWDAVPSQPGVYIILDQDECLYIGMAGRDGAGTLRKRLKDHSSGQVVNMFAQYLFLARVQFASEQRITHPRAAKTACRNYILARCSFRYVALSTPPEARSLESKAEKRTSTDP